MHTFKPNNYSLFEHTSLSCLCSANKFLPFPCPVLGRGYELTTDGQADGMTHNRCLRKQMAQQMFLTHTIETDVFDPHNRNRWPHNSRATAFCHAWPILLFALVAAFIPLLLTSTRLVAISTTDQTINASLIS